MTSPSSGYGSGSKVGLAWASAALAVCLLASVACGSTPSPQVMPSALASPFVVPTATNLPQPTTPTAAPQGLSPHGPYVLFAGQHDGVWIANADGSFPTRLSEQWLFGFDLHRALSPQGDRLAVVTQDEQGFDLVEIHLPDGGTRRLAHLMTITPEEQAVATSDKAITAMMISQYDNVAWQPPDGRLIAFAAATNGPTSDIYTVDTTSGEARQLTDGPSQAIFPSWSPDGQYVYHIGVSLVPPFGGAIVGYNRMDGSWAVRVSDEAIIAQVTLSNPQDFLGWLGRSHYAIQDVTGRLTQVEVATGEAVAFPDLCPVSEAAQATGSLVFFLSIAPELNCPSGPGIFRWTPGGTAVPVLPTQEKTYGLTWLPESAVFDVYPIALFPPSGTGRYDPPVPDASFKPAVSKKGYQAWEVIENRQGRVVVRSPGGDWQDILDAYPAALLWDPVSGETLLIAAEDGTLYAASAPDFTPRVTGNLGGRMDQAIWVP